MNAKPWWVYIIQTESGKLYTGITNNLERRFEEHQSHKKGARFFHLDKAKEMVFSENYANRSLASKRESEIKKMSRLQKLDLIQSLDQI